MIENKCDLKSNCMRYRWPQNFDFSNESAVIRDRLTAIQNLHGISARTANSLTNLGDFHRKITNFLGEISLHQIYCLFNTQLHIFLGINFVNKFDKFNKFSCYLMEV